MKKTLVVANWKMHLNTHEASTLVHRLHDNIALHREVEVVLAPSMLALQPLSLEIDRRKFKLAAQNAYYKDEGAFTGEVSFTMLQDLVHYAIIGHSERRLYFQENLDIIRNKVAAAVRNGITPILCIGETKQEHADGEGKQVIHDQLTTALADLTSEDMDKIVLVYEPQWTITSFGGTPAKPDEVEKAIAYMRRQVSELYGAAAADDVRVLYGGSVDEQDVRAYLEVPGCDGVLVGSASLNYHKFASIVDTAYQVKQGQKG
ncbi:MAG TPA: triose-phosphate isomerase [Candidatus Saccharimonadales bacterium]|nr:triose-phosphate isomerase [Candidatus Saccharimonadales bacterium]